MRWLLSTLSTKDDPKMESKRIDTFEFNIHLNLTYYLLMFIHINIIIIRSSIPHHKRFWTQIEIMHRYNARSVNDTKKLSKSRMITCLWTDECIRGCKSRCLTHGWLSTLRRSPHTYIQSPCTSEHSLKTADHVRPFLAVTGDTWPSSGDMVLHFHKKMDCTFGD